MLTKDEAQRRELVGTILGMVFGAVVTACFFLASNAWAGIR